MESGITGLRVTSREPVIFYAGRLFPGGGAISRGGAGSTGSGAGSSGSGAGSTGGPFSGSSVISRRRRYLLWCPCLQIFEHHDREIALLRDVLRDLGGREQQPDFTTIIRNAGDTKRKS